MCICSCRSLSASGVMLNHRNGLRPPHPAPARLPEPSAALPFAGMPLTAWQRQTSIHTRGCIHNPLTSKPARRHMVATLSPPSLQPPPEQNKSKVVVVTVNTRRCPLEPRSRAAVRRFGSSWMQRPSRQAPIWHVFSPMTRQGPSDRDEAM